MSPFYEIMKFDNPKPAKPKMAIEFSFENTHYFEDSEIIPILRGLPRNVVDPPLEDTNIIDGGLTALSDKNKESLGK